MTFPVKSEYNFRSHRLVRGRKNGGTVNFVNRRFQRVRSLPLHCPSTTVIGDRSGLTRCRPVCRNMASPTFPCPHTTNPLWLLEMVFARAMSPPHRRSPPPLFWPKVQEIFFNTYERYKTCHLFTIKRKNFLDSSNKSLLCDVSVNVILILGKTILNTPSNSLSNILNKDFPEYLKDSP